MNQLCGKQLLHSWELLIRYGLRLAKTLLRRLTLGCKPKYSFFCAIAALSPLEGAEAGEGLIAAARQIYIFIATSGVPR